MKKTFFLISIIVLSACTAPPAEIPEKSPETTIPEAPEALQAGEIPFDYPVVQTSAEKDQIVLAPSKTTIEELIENGRKDAITIFYKATLYEVGPAESLVQDQFEQTYKVPNSLIIPLETDNSVAVGDIVLTWWQGGSGMMQALVTAIDEETGLPTVRYLDKFADQPETLASNTFQVLNQTLTPGSRLIAFYDNNYEYATLIHQSNDQALLMGFAGFLHPAQSDNLFPLPAPADLQDLAVDDTIYVPVIGAFTEATITSLGLPNGLLTARYSFANQTLEDTFFINQIALELPAHTPKPATPVAPVTTEEPPAPTGATNILDSF